MDTLMENGTQEMFEQLTLPIFQELTAGLSEHHAKTFQSQAGEQGLTEKEAALYEKFLESWKSSKKKINPHGLSTKTLRECFLATEDLTSYQSSLKWTDSGTISSGKISTQDGSFRKTGSAYTLLDVIEEEVDDKYFLSREMAGKIVQGN